MPALHSTADEAVRTAILTALAADPRTSGASLRVGVLNGIAHLAGAVDTLDRRHAAEALAASIPGVRAVANRIEAPGAPSPARPIHLKLITPTNKHREEKSND